MSTYKPFKPQDYSIVPFNAHKQYNFDSSSAAANKVTYLTTYWDADPIDQYTTNSVNYNQIDHLFYRNYLTDISNKFGDINYLKHKRVLYERANILSIPTGLYGHKVNPGSFFLSSSFNKIVDDTYGNLIISGTNISNYITDPRSKLLDVGPVKGFKRYDLDIYEEYLEGIYYKKGQKRVNTISSYSTPSTKHEYDDSYFLNPICYKNVTFDQFFLEDHFAFSSLFNDADSIPLVEFNGVDSEIKLYHDNKFNLNKGDNFSIEFWINPQHPLQAATEHIIGKSTTKTIIPAVSEGTVGAKSLSTTGSSQFIDVPSEQSYPFEVYLKYKDDPSQPIESSRADLYFQRSNGEKITFINTGHFISTNTPTHVVCRYSSSQMSIFVNGGQFSSDVEDIEGTYQNNANLYIGNKGGYTNYFSGSLSQIKIYNQALTNTHIENNYNSINGSPYVGNIFYSNGIATITHPRYQRTLSLLSFGIGTMAVDNENEDIAIFTVGNPHNISNISQLKFQGSHLIYEHEYKCTIDEYEYNNTLNPSVRKHKSLQTEELSDFATGSLFKPYITTIGLYNEKNELLVVGKLGQPIRTSNETDTTLIVRWDT